LQTGAESRAAGVDADVPVEQRRACMSVPAYRMLSNAVGNGGFERAARGSEWRHDTCIA
jgi:hypothetical protein